MILVWGMYYLNLKKTLVSPKGNTSVFCFGVKYSVSLCDEFLLFVNVIDDSNSTVEIADLTDLKIYPNPVSDNLTIENNSSFSLEMVALYFSLGNKVISSKPVKATL